MNRTKLIRQHLGLTQKALGEAIDCSQACILAYEQGRALPHKRAEKLIEYAATRGCVLDFNHVYGQRPLPRWVSVDVDDAVADHSSAPEGHGAEPAHA
ncbi:helix-turn-helix domain-containing protein [Acidovorax sp. LjRoot117]|uniref:helix-turn-helix domain-containing protein n=1 Tax=Acidovorax sp. LjRoot117 TaxID=3342255 RepID=UPI003ECD8682